jgi:hypothetical protein
VHGSVVCAANRSGLTDTRYTFGAYKAWAVVLRAFTIPYIIDREWALGVETYARSIGSQPPPPLVLEQPEETKECPDCAETVMGPGDPHQPGGRDHE